MEYRNSAKYFSAFLLALVMLAASMAPSTEAQQNILRVEMNCIVSSFNPLQAQRDICQAVWFANLLYEPLILNLFNGTLVPWLAKSWEILDDGKRYVFIDTAGLRRKSRIEKKSLEYFSVKRAIDAIESADVVVLLIDAVEGVSRQDKRIAGLILDRGKALVIDVNKFDLVDSKMSDYERAVRAEMPFANFCRVVFTSAIKKQGLKQLLTAIDEAYSSYCRRVEQTKLNRLLMQLPVLAPSLESVKIYSIKQVKIKPPKFVVTVNREEGIREEGKRMLQRLIRERVDPFMGSPIFLEFKQRR